MSSSSNTPILPISTSAAERPSLGTLAVRGYRSARHALHHRRPWTEFLDVNSVSKPTSFSDAASRIRNNFSYFRSNYLTLLATAMALSLVTHPFSLLTLLSLLAAWTAFYALHGQPFVLWGRKFSDREALGVLLTATAIAMFLTSLGSLIVSGLAIGAAIVSAHGAFRSPEVMFVHQDSSSSTPSDSSFSFVGSVISAPVVPPVF